MVNWSEVRSLMLTIIREDSRFSNHDDNNLNQWILGTGYYRSPNPNTSTLDLISVYAANLRNSGAPGPLADKCAQMISGAISNRNWIVENSIKQITERDLADACLEFIGANENFQLVKNTTTNYEGQLRNLNKGVLVTLIRSVSRFIDLLCTNYNGNAIEYSRSFDLNLNSKDLIKMKFKEISGFPGIGIPLAMNFLKDSQIPSIANRSLNQLITNPIAGFVKPDKHVMRLMLCASGRFSQTNIINESLFNMKDKDTVRLYRDYAPNYLGQNDYCLGTDDHRNSIPYWKCIEDIHNWSIRDQTPPIEIDRILYLIGSGRYGPVTNGIADAVPRLSVTQYSRYARFINLFQ